ncbi:MAG: hypothetical protein WCG47_32725 [Dermatophilaceae bacterium]
MLHQPDDVWLVRTEPGLSDWLHEREWRVPVPEKLLQLVPSDLTAVLVGDPSWRPVVSDVGLRSPDFSETWFVERLPTLLERTPRWYRDGSRLHLFDPFSDEVEHVRLL